MVTALAFVAAVAGIGWMTCHRALGRMERLLKVRELLARQSERRLIGDELTLASLLMTSSRVPVAPVRLLAEAMKSEAEPQASRAAIFDAARKYRLENTPKSLFKC